VPGDSALDNTLPGYGILLLPRGTAAGVYGYTPDEEAYLKRLRRTEGQVRGLHLAGTGPAGRR